MTSSISLNCSILGPDVTASFIVEVSLDASVGKLKRLVEEVENELNKINARRLDIWKVSDTAQLIRHR